MAISDAVGSGHDRRSVEPAAAVSRAALAVRVEAVADPRLGDEVLRVARIGLELLAQLAHEHAQVLGLLLRGLAPHGLEKRAVRDDAVRMPRHVDEEIELLRREAHFLAARVHAPTLEVDAEFADVERRDLGLAAAAAQRRADA